ncbi:MAG: glycosyltransferase family 4 protein, partial [Chloroflexota bacterium]|nr:glycosyltransferase family 4 protein [Chloroflexota bacterium]
MKVLFVAPEDPFARDGGANLRLRPFVEAVATAGEAQLLTLGPRHAKAAPTAPFASVETVMIRRPGRPTRLLRTLLTGEPDIAFRSRSARMATTLHRRLLSEPFDAVHLAGLQLAYLVQPFRDTLAEPGGDATRRPLLLLDELNAEYVVHQRLAASDEDGVAGWRRAYSLAQMALLRRYERRVLPQCDIVTCPGAADLASLRELAPKANLAVVASGVGIEALAKVPAPPNNPIALFVGDLDYRPNRQAAEWLLEQVAPAVWEGVPEARFVFVGPGRRPDARDTGGRITFTGYVDDVAPHLAAARVIVAPLRSGGGIKLKVLEGMAAGRAVVTTP